MPFYTYRAKDTNNACDFCRNDFEEIQGIREDPLTICPECGNPIGRIFHPTAQNKVESTQKLLSDDNLKKHGFKKLVNRGGGKFDEVV